MASTHIVLGGAGGSSGGIDPAVITAKGDLIAGTGSGTYDNLAVGTNNYLLQANSAETTGLGWIEATDQQVNSTIVKRDASGNIEVAGVKNSAGQTIWRTDAAAAYSASNLLMIDMTGAKPVLWQGFSFANSSLSPAITLSTKTSGTNQTYTWPSIAQFANATMCVSNSTSELQWFGARAPITSKTTAYTATESDGTILCDTTSAGFTVTLPAASGKAGMMLYIKKISSDGNTLTVDGNASETIDGATTLTTTTQYDGWQIHCDGSNWHIVGNF